MVSTSSRRRLLALPLALALALSASLLPASSAAGDDDEPLLNPLPDPAPSDLGIVVEEFAQLPASEPIPPPTDQRLMRHNRINYLGEIPDGSGRMYVPDLNGMMYLLEDDGSFVEYLDVRGAFEDDFHNHAGLGTGFGFVTFHPEFAENGKFYTVHTESGDALTEQTPDLPTFGNQVTQGIITEWTATDPSADTFSGTSREMLRVGFGGRIHGFQQIEFKPTAEPGDEDYGLLYLLVGDGGNGVNSANPQNLATPHGKIFRIDPLGSNSSNGKYGIPDSNPFVDEPGALGEIYAVGMRDPHRISWDPGTDNRMFLGHIGEWQIESIYEVRKGDNFGWSEREGPFLAMNRQIFPLPDNDDEFGFTYPVAAYDHNRDPGQTGDAGVAVSGGNVYRGSIPQLKGRYLFTDLVRGHVYSARAGQLRQERDELAPIEHLKVFADGEETTFAELVGDDRVDLRFGIDAEGELYLLAKANGTIWKVVGAHRARPGESHPDVLPSLWRNMVAYYDFEHPVPASPAHEQDQGRSGTNIELINGGAQMRVNDGAYPASETSVQLRQVDPTAAGNDDWKAGVYAADGVSTLSAFSAATETTIMGWFKMTGQNPSPNSNSSNPDDFFGAVGLAGVLSGDSDGHAVRSLLELINVSGELRLVALGRRVDGASSQTFAAAEDWQTLLPPDEWVHLAATFDYDNATMQLYRNGQPLDGFYTRSDDPWDVEGDPEPDLTSDTDSRGIKIGGSFPQNNRETNPCNCRMDGLMFLDRVLNPGEVLAQYRRAVAGVG